MVKQQVDILIIGGGLTGASLLLALSNLGYKTVLVEANPSGANIKEDFDARSLALSPASIQILKMIKIWPLIADKACAIEAIHVSEQRRFGSARLLSKDAKPLGHLVELPTINQALYQLIDTQQLIAPGELTALDCQQGLATILCGKQEITLEAKLIVAADGTTSKARKLLNLSVDVKDYQQHALVSNIGLSRPHYHWAYERFTSTGPLALLPMTDSRMALVWSLAPTQAKQLQTMADDEFLSVLQRAFGYRLGRLVKTGKRVIFPLQQSIMPQQVQGRVVFVGNAAHTLHPVAGQGFNLGLRDIAMLAQCIATYGVTFAALESYQKNRQHDQKAIIQFTDGLVSLFTSSLPGVGCARSLGLLAFDNSNLLKKLVGHYARGYAGTVPDLVCGIPLVNQESL